MPASPSSTPTFCSAATKSSIIVPLVVKIAIRMKANMATEGPASQSHHETPRKPLLRERRGARVDPDRGEPDVDDAPADP